MSVKERAEYFIYCQSIESRNLDSSDTFSIHYTREMAWLKHARVSGASVILVRIRILNF